MHCSFLNRLDLFDQVKEELTSWVAFSSTADHCPIPCAGRSSKWPQKEFGHATFHVSCAFRTVACRRFWIATRKPVHFGQASLADRSRATLRPRWKRKSRKFVRTNQLWWAGKSRTNWFNRASATKTLLHRSARSAAYAAVDAQTARRIQWSVSVHSCF